MTIVRCVVTGLGLIALAACATPEAPSRIAASWSPAELLGPGRAPRVVGDAAGAALAAWLGSSLPDDVELITRRYEPATGWSHPSVAASHLHSFDLAAAPGGDALLAWMESVDPGDDRSAQVLVCRVPSDAWCTTPERVSRPESDPRSDSFAPPALHVGARGSAALAWVQHVDSRHRIWVARAEPGAPFATAELAAEVEGTAWTLSPAAITAAAVDVAVDTEGTAFLAWRSFVPGSSRIHVCALARGQSSCTIETLAARPVAFRPPDPVAIAALPSGEAHVVWTHSSGLRGDRGEVWSARYVPNSGWQPATEIGPDRALAPGESPAVSPRVAGLGNGDVVALWQQWGESTQGYDLWSARFVAGRGWQGARLVERATEEVHEPSLAISPLARGGLASWFDTGSRAPRLWTREFSEAGDWSEAQEVPRGLDQFLPSHPPQLAVDATGRALVVWGEDPGLPGQQWVWFSRLTPASR
ncbi:MAG TPA: hypothetical protein VFQ51_12015 [Vicinamibacteria bacterium]|nr:hypothetical protein [Vicinamibacteria bacterium]